MNKFFNVTCSKLLNRGFVMVEKYHSQSLKRVKSQLPRRESERRNHALARHCDVLSAIETRLSLLSMTFSKVRLPFCWNWSNWSIWYSSSTWTCVASFPERSSMKYTEFFGSSTTIPVHLGSMNFFKNWEIFHPWLWSILRRKLLRTLNNVSFHLDHSTVLSCLHPLLRVSSLFC